MAAKKNESKSATPPNTTSVPPSVETSSSREEEIKRTKGKRYGISPEQFVKTWQTCSSVCEVAEKLGVPVLTVNGRATRYRKLGVNLKHMKKSGGFGKKLDTETLNALCATE